MATLQTVTGAGGVAARLLVRKAHPQCAVLQGALGGPHEMKGKRKRERGIHSMVYSDFKARIAYPVACAKSWRKKRQKI